jgi:hypothetical protein
MPTDRECRPIDPQPTHLGFRGTPDYLRGKALAPPDVTFMQCPDRGIRKPRRIGFAKLQ